MEFWSDGVMECWSFGVMEFWSAGVLECWSNGVLEFWSAGVLECWSFGVMLSEAASPDPSGKSRHCRRVISPML